MLIWTGFGVTASVRVYVRCNTLYAWSVLHETHCYASNAYLPMKAPRFQMELFNVSRFLSSRRHTVVSSAMHCSIHTHNE